jgi:hypothetical protein
MPSRDEQARLSFADQLEATPIKNEKAVATATEADAVRVRVPQIYPPWLRSAARALGLRKEKSYELEGVGRAVYDRVDGTSSVENLVDWLAEQHRLSFHESRVLIIEYLQMLMQRGLIVIVANAPSLNVSNPTAQKRQ